MFLAGGQYFFTVVTHRRRCLFADERARTLLRSVMEDEQEERPFEIVAMVLLPEHLHCIWQLPDGDADFSMRWGQIKRRFSQAWRAGGVDDGNKGGGQCPPLTRTAKTAGGTRPTVTKRSAGWSRGAGAIDGVREGYGRRDSGSI